MRNVRSSGRAAGLIGLAAALLLALAATTASAAPGQLDLTLATGVGFDGTVAAIEAQTDGKLVVGGGFGTYATSAAPYLVRLNADGSIDRTFATSAFDGAVRAIAIQADGKLVVGGDFTHYGTTIVNRIARLSPDGTLDATYAVPTGAGFDATVYDLALQPDGNLLVAGSFTQATGTVSGTTFHGIARVKATDGTIDTAFHPTGAGLDGSVSSIALQPNGKLLIGGGFTHLEGSSLQRVARLNTDGSMDHSFRQPGDGAGYGLDAYVQAIALQADGSVVVSGLFTTYQTTGRAHIARLTSTGALDAGFDPGTGLTGGAGTAPALAVLPTGKILVGGDYAAFNGTGRANIAQLNSDGTLDALFSTGTGFDAAVATLTIVAGSALVGGNFATYGGTARAKLARLQDAASVSVTKLGAGAGTVTSTVGGIACGETCSTWLSQGGSVTLTAAATTGSTFDGWGGACSGTARTCVLTLSSAALATATFVPSNAFTTTKPKAKVTAKTIVLTSTVRVPGSGQLVVSALLAAGARTKTLCVARKTAATAGAVNVTCTIGKAGRAALRRANLTLIIRTTYTPTAGTAAAKDRLLGLKRRL